MTYKIIIRFLITAILCSGIFLCSCAYNDLGLFTAAEEEISPINQRNSEKELNANSREFFLNAKEKQMNKNPLNDINVRKAIFYAIDREKIVSELFGEYNQIHNSLFSEDSYYYYQSWEKYNYNTEMAEEFLSRAGYGIDNPLYITIGSVSDSSTKEAIEEIIKDNLSSIGIKIWIFNKPAEEWYRDCVGKGEYELGIWSIYNFDGSNLDCSFGSGKIPPMVTEENTSCENFYWYSSEKADEILRKIKNESNIDIKKELFENLQEILADDAVVLPLYNRMFYIASNNEKLKNIDIKIINNEMIFNLENWILQEGENTEENVKEIVIGFGAKDYTLDNLFKTNYISNLLLKGLWEVNESGQYESIMVEEEFASDYDINTSPEKKVKVILKDEIYWEDGSTIKSEDVKYTYEILLENENLKIADKDLYKIQEIEVINEKEFNIIFRENIPDWKKLFGFILQQDSLAGKDMDNFSIEDIAANGPYKIERYISGEYLLLKKNDYYFKELPEIDYFKVVFNSDINNLISMLKSEEVDLLSIPFDINLIKSIEEDKDLDILIKPGNLIEHLALCLKPKE